MVPRSTRNRAGCQAWFPSLLLMIVVLALSTRTSLAELPPSSTAPPSAESLTQTVVALNVRYQLAGPAAKAKLLTDLLTVAAARRQLLSQLMETDPGEVLRVALPTGLRKGFPTAVQAELEAQVEIEGVLEVLHEDRDPGSRYLYFLEAAGERLSLHFAADPPTDRRTGDRIRVTGVRLGLALALQSSTTSVQALTTALPNTFGAQNTLVILVNFQDKTIQPYTVATAQGIVFSQTSNFDLENSYQQTSLTGDVAGWFTSPLSSTVCDTSTLASQAKSAATAAGVNLAAYTRYVYAFPQNACTWWGLGTVGGNPSQAWINGSLAVKVVGHEMGHNFGLYHSHALECGSTTLGTSCSTVEYGDTLDIMGNPSAGHFSAFQKERLGWLNYGVSPPLTTVQADGTYWLDPYESPGANPKALKVLKSTDPTTGKKTWYYVEYRQAIGFDSFLSSYSNVLNGVVIHTGSESSANSSDLLDMTAATSSWSDPALDVGQSFYDPDAGVTIAPTWASSANAAVGVTLGSLACVPANPTVTLSPSQSQWVQAGTAVTYTVSVTNNDNAGCAASSFNVQATAPSGWTASLASSTLSVSPGASASTTMTVTSPVFAADGFYTIGVAATNSTNSAYTASTSATYVIISSLNVGVSTDRLSYTRTQQVSITATVSAGSSPVSGASVTFTITKPNGAVVTASATTGANGSALFKLRLSKKDPAGLYQVTADANLNNAIFGTGGTSFTVQ